MLDAEIASLGAGNPPDKSDYPPRHFAEFLGLTDLSQSYAGSSKKRMAPAGTQVP
jgi:hypothetical protein